MDETQLNDTIWAMASGGTTTSQADPSGTNWAAGLMQNALALGTSYLSRRIDIDLQQRLAGLQPAVSRVSNQTPLNESPDLTTRGVAAVSGLRLGNILPLLVVGGAVFLLLRR